MHRLLVVGEVAGLLLLLLLQRRLHVDGLWLEALHRWTGGQCGGVEQAAGIGGRQDGAVEGSSVGQGILKTQSGCTGIIR